MNLLGRVPQVPFKEGLKKTYEWYVESRIWTTSSGL